MSFKKITALLLAALMVAGLLAGCGQTKTAPQSPESAAPAAAEPEAPPSGTRTITDGLGRQVEVPQQVERIVTLGNATRMATYLQLTDKLVSVASGDQNKSLFMAYGVYHQEA